jgi:hypothetical protein
MTAWRQKLHRRTLAGAAALPPNRPEANIERCLRMTTVVNRLNSQFSSEQLIQASTWSADLVTVPRGMRMTWGNGAKIPAVLIVEDEALVRLGAVKIIRMPASRLLKLPTLTKQ